jgi:uncharacterized membrane protein
MYGENMRDPAWIRSILAIHIAAGFTAFVMAPVTLACAKGGKAHRRWGKVYFWSMAVVGGSALVLAIYRPILFLALVAIFSFYAAFSGYRVLFHKNLPQGQKVTWPDWMAAILTFTCSLALALLGALRPQLVGNLAIPAVVFGIIGMWLGVKSVWRFVHPPKEKMFWWYEHLTSMLVSYVAAWTAFSVTTIGPLVHPRWVIWVLPTIIGVPAITMTNAYYRRKFAPRKKVGVA